MSEHNKELRTANRAYAGFLIATALVVSAKAETIPYAGLIVFLFAISIPSAIAYSGLARITEVDEQRNPQLWSAISFALAYFPSLIALSMLMSAASIFASIAFLITSAAWVIIVVRIRRST